MNTKTIDPDKITVDVPAVLLAILGLIFGVGIVVSAAYEAGDRAQAPQSIICQEEDSIQFERGADGILRASCPE